MLGLFSSDLSSSFRNSSKLKVGGGLEGKNELKKRNEILEGLIKNNDFQSSIFDHEHDRCKRITSLERENGAF